MRNILMICFLVTFASALAASQSDAADITSLDAKIRQIRESIELQIERIKGAREKSDTEMNLARIRLSEQLRRSQEDLYRQLAALERFREQLGAQIAEANGIMNDYQKNWKSIMEQALADMEAQVHDTNALMEQMEAVRNNLDSALEDNTDCNRSARGINCNKSRNRNSGPSSGFLPLPEIRFSPQPPISPAPDTGVPLAPDVQTHPPTIPVASNPPQTELPVAPRPGG
jgi:hypothetical protein